MEPSADEEDKIRPFGERERDQTRSVWPESDAARSIESTHITSHRITIICWIFFFCEKNFFSQKKKKKKEKEKRRKSPQKFKITTWHLARRRLRPPTPKKRPMKTPTQSKPSTSKPATPFSTTSKQSSTFW
jgi:hypothetical protein